MAMKKAHFSELQSIFGESRVKIDQIGQDQLVKMEPLKGNLLQKISSGKSKIDSFEKDSYTAPALRLVTIGDCDIITCYGLLKVSDYIVQESDFHFPFWLYPGLDEQNRQAEPGSIIIPNTAKNIEANKAFYSHGGINWNYFHWMMFYIAKFSDSTIARVVEHFEGPPLSFWPPFVNDLQRETANFWTDRSKFPNLRLDLYSRVRVDELVFPDFGGGGLTPHPTILETFKTMKKLFLKSGSRFKKIFISRKDAANRPLQNEDELRELLLYHDFTIVNLSGVSISDQISIFSGAEIIVGSHGAGLTNIVFCNEGVKVVELHMSTYLHWGFRRLSAVCNFQYRCVIGEPIGDILADSQSQSFYIDPKVLVEEIYT